MPAISNPVADLHLLRLHAGTLDTELQAAADVEAQALALVARLERDAQIHGGRLRGPAAAELPPGEAAELQLLAAATETELADARKRHGRHTSARAGIEFAQQEVAQAGRDLLAEVGRLYNGKAARDCVERLLPELDHVAAHPGALVYHPRAAEPPHHASWEHRCGVAAAALKDRVWKAHRLAVSLLNECAAADAALAADTQRWGAFVENVAAAFLGVVARVTELSLSTLERVLRGKGGAPLCAINVKLSPSGKTLAFSPEPSRPSALFATVAQHILSAATDLPHLRDVITVRAAAPVPPLVAPADALALCTLPAAADATGPDPAPRDVIVGFGPVAAAVAGVEAAGAALAPALSDSVAVLERDWGYLWQPRAAEWQVDRLTQEMRHLPVRMLARMPVGDGAALELNLFQLQDTLLTLLQQYLGQARARDVARRLEDVAAAIEDATVGSARALPPKSIVPATALATLGRPAVRPAPEPTPEPEAAPAVKASPRGSAAAAAVAQENRGGTPRTPRTPSAASSATGPAAKPAPQRAPTPPSMDPPGSARNRRASGHSSVSHGSPTEPLPPPAAAPVAKQPPVRPMPPPTPPAPKAEPRAEVAPEKKEQTPSEPKAPSSTVASTAASPTHSAAPESPIHSAPAPAPVPTQAPAQGPAQAPAPKPTETPQPTEAEPPKPTGATPKATPNRTPEPSTPTGPGAASIPADALERGEPVPAPPAPEPRPQARRSPTPDLSAAALLEAAAPAPRPSTTPVVKREPSPREASPIGGVTPEPKRRDDGTPASGRGGPPLSQEIPRSAIRAIADAQRRAPDPSPKRPSPRGQPAWETPPRPLPPSDGTPPRPQGLGTPTSPGAGRPGSSGCSPAADRSWAQPARGFARRPPSPASSPNAARRPPTPSGPYSTNALPPVAVSSAAAATAAAAAAVAPGYAGAEEEADLEELMRRERESIDRLRLLQQRAAARADAKRTEERAARRSELTEPAVHPPPQGLSPVRPPPQPPAEDPVERARRAAAERRRDEDLLAQRLQEEMEQRADQRRREREARDQERREDLRRQREAHEAERAADDQRERELRLRLDAMERKARGGAHPPLPIPAPPTGPGPAAPHLPGLGSAPGTPRDLAQGQDSGRNPAGPAGQALRRRASGSTASVPLPALSGRHTPADATPPRAESPATGAPPPAPAEPEPPGPGVGLLDMYKAECQRRSIKPNSGLLKKLPRAVGECVAALDLDLNYIGVRGVLPLIEVLRVNRGLELLNLKDNNLENAEVRALVDVLLGPSGAALRHLDLSNNPVSLAGGSAVMELVQRQPSLRTVVLKGTLVQASIVDKIAAAAAANSGR